MKMTNVLYLLPLLALSGCALSEDLSPPADGKTVKVSVVKPADVDILPMDVIYRSEKCRDKVFTSTGAITSRAGYHLLTVPFKPETGSGIVSNRVALDGGGQCEWKLSNIRFQFKFSDMTKFGADIKNNIPNDIVYVFDNNPPPRGNGHYEDVYGDIKIENDYYPLVIYDRIIDHAKTLSIESEKMLAYRVHDGRSIFFEPHVYSDKLVRILGPEKIGDNTLSIYPDGTQTLKKKGSYPLDFKKLKEIK
ncbi:MULTISPECIES: hypothetical protein [Citrobacter]|uniref:hypothetical protein n=2 Tax=Enterobacteriaceae TaxID=543 RepID=UPI0015EA0A27|nr:MULTISPECIES: hypothetical protein [Citrobacter]EHG7581557.1 hypothetical protein [Citrobacter sedlakii]EIQ7156976.1 hypothetical protein [Citrobacter sedlakii]MBN6599959.1 hypothetical protein [Citrobacter sedlakii]QMK45489.1 hypothetical protein HVX72_07360 [Citrobacter sp. RHB21-C05]QMK63933.1 hypothetical protein HVX68_07360 [Citrobacter sp. RHB21-C01]